MIMTKMTKKTITVESTEITVMLKRDKEDYISLTDMARYKDTERTNYIIQNWMRNRSTIEYLGVWEQLNNPDFKGTEFDAFRSQAGLNAFTLTPKQWIERTNAIGIVSKPGRYGGGTYAHKDIAFNFGMWLSPTFQLYIVREYQRLREAENNPLLEHWDVKRILSKTNYTLHTDAIKTVIIPKLDIGKWRQRIEYAKEADMLNLVVFGCTADDWEKANPLLAKKHLNIRDTASINQLVVLSNLESINSELIKGNIPREQRFSILHRIAKDQISILSESHAELNFRKLEGKDPTDLLE